MLTIWWVNKYSRNFDYFIGFDNLNAFTGNLLKKFGAVKKTIFYTIDYIPNRFSNNILNYIYHFLDKLAVEKSNAVWNLSSIMVDEREKKGISPIYRKKQFVVPIGTILVKENNIKIDRFKIVHIGHLRKNQGLETLIYAMKDVIKIVPNAHLCIIGGGPLEESLKNQVKKMKLGKHIEFTGFLPNYSDAEKYLEDSGIGVAPYDNNKNSFTRYTDPGKPKDYLANGIPVVITKVPQVAYEIEKRQCGIAVEYSRKNIADAIVKILTMPQDRYLEFRKNSIRMAKDYTWDKVFNRAFAKTFALNE